MCNGHGTCVGGSHCVCDPSYSGADCSVPDTPNPDFLKEDFEGTPTYRHKSSGNNSVSKMYVCVYVCVVVIAQSELAEYQAKLFYMVAVVYLSLFLFIHIFN